MSCECPTEVYVDVDNLPKPALYSVRKFDGASLDDTGEWLYGIVRKTSGGTVHKLLRWPYPALNAYEELVDTGATAITYPRVVGSSLYYLQAAAQSIYVTDATVGGPGTLVGTFDIDTPGRTFACWGVGWATNRLWVAYQAYDSGSPNFFARSGVVGMTTAGAWTAYQFNGANDNGTNPHLFSAVDLVVTTDDAVWLRLYGNGAPNGFDGLARFDTGALTWDSTAETENIFGHSPLNDNQVRARDTERVGIEIPRVVAADMTSTVDPCATGLTTDSDLAAGGFVAWSANYSTIVYKKVVTDQLMAVGCTVAAGGWTVGSVAF